MRLHPETRNPTGASRRGLADNQKLSAPKFTPAALDAQARGATIIGRRYRLRLTVARIVAASIIGVTP